MNKEKDKMTTTYRRRLIGIDKASGDKWCVRKYLLNSFGITRSGTRNKED